MLSLSISNSLCIRTNITSPLMSHRPRVMSRYSPSPCPENANIGITTQGEGIFGNPIVMPPKNDPYLRVGLRRELVPKHVAAILDGNRRWAKAHGKELDYEPFCHGYLALADLCIKWGVGTLSCFLFSTENWKRTKEANDLLFSQFKRCLEESSLNFARKGIKLCVLGDKARLPKSLQEVIKQVEEKTKSNSKLELNFAVNYGGKWDIAQAIRSICTKARAGQIQLQDIDEALMNHLLSTHSLQTPDPDLMIRTGGDKRVSNFFMWQMYQTEFYFTDVYGPDFGEPDFIDALSCFQKCDRLFGK